MKYLILAGGTGSRLWPLSRAGYPKQFLSLIDDKSMLQNTILRVSSNPEDIYIVTNKSTSHIIYQQIKDIFPSFSKTHIILEPVGRNTAPAIAYGLLGFDDNDVVAVLSADAYIADEAGFVSVLNEAGSLAMQNYIVTLGITPTSPATGYGYIMRSEQKAGSGYIAQEFVEKPDLPTAQSYVDSGKYFWNAGIFVFRVKTFYEELAKYAPNISEVALSLKGKSEISESDYSRFDKISVDYAVMEHSSRVAVIEADIGWNDIGSFKSLYEILPKDDNRNVCKIDKSKLISVNSNSNYFHGNKQIIAIGVDNLVVADTDDALLISSMECCQQIKDATNILEKQNPTILNKSNISYKEYGTCKVLLQTKTTKVLELTILPEQSVPSHYHKWSTNNITVVSGTADITIDDKQMRLEVTESCHIKRNQVHKFTNKSQNEILKIIEIIITNDTVENDMFYLD